MPLPHGIELQISLDRGVNDGVMKKVIVVGGGLAGDCGRYGFSRSRRSRNAARGPATLWGACGIVRG